MLPSSSDASAEAPESVLGMVRLVEVVLKPGKWARPPLVKTGVTGAHAQPRLRRGWCPGNFHYLAGRPLPARLSRASLSEEWYRPLAREVSIAVAYKWHPASSEWILSIWITNREWH